MTLKVVYHTCKDCRQLKTRQEDSGWGKLSKKNPVKLVKALAQAQMLVMGVSLPMGAEGMRLEFKLEVGTQMVPFEFYATGIRFQAGAAQQLCPLTLSLPSDLRQPLNSILGWRE